MKTNRKFEKGQVEFERQRNARIQHRQVNDSITVQWERPTYMDHIGRNTSDKWRQGDFIQSMRDSVKPGQMMTDSLYVKPPEIRLPGAGFGYASIHGSFLHANGRNVESRLRGLGLTHPHTPAPPAESSSMHFHTVNTYAPTMGIESAPIQYIKRPGWM